MSLSSISSKSITFQEKTISLHLVEDTDSKRFEFEISGINHRSNLKEILDLKNCKFKKLFSKFKPQAFTKDFLLSEFLKVFSEVPSKKELKKKEKYYS